MAKLVAEEFIIRHLYEDRRLSDAEIARELKLDRTTIVKARSKYGITTRKSTGKIGEELLAKELRARGHIIQDMNEMDKLSPFDLLTDDGMRIEVKSSMLSKLETFVFTFSEKPSNQNRKDETRVLLDRGRTKKIFSKSCDIIICVGIEPNGFCHFYMFTPEYIDNEVRETISTPLNPFSKTKFNNHRELWNMVERKKVAASTAT